MAAVTAGVAATLGCYSFLGAAFDVDIAEPYWTVVIFLAFVTLLVFLAVMLYDGLRSLLLRLRSTESQERELYAVFQAREARLRVRPGDYRLGSDRIVGMARQWGYRLAGESNPYRSYRRLLVFRSDLIPVSAEEAEIVRHFTDGGGVVELATDEYRVSWSRITELAAAHGYRPVDGSGHGDSHRPGRFARKGNGKKKRSRWYQDRGCLALLILFWPLAVAFGILWTFFRRWELYILGGAVCGGTVSVFPEHGKVVVSAFLYGYLPLVTLVSLWSIWRDHRSKRRPDGEQVAEIEHRFTDASGGTVRISWVRYSLGEERIKKIAERHGYRHVLSGRSSRWLRFKPATPREPARTG